MHFWELSECLCRRTLCVGSLTTLNLQVMAAEIEVVVLRRQLRACRWPLLAAQQHSGELGLASLRPNLVLFTALLMRSGQIWRSAKGCPARWGLSVPQSHLDWLAAVADLRTKQGTQGFPLLLPQCQGIARAARSSTMLRASAASLRPCDTCRPSPRLRRLPFLPASSCVVHGADSSARNSELAPCPVRPSTPCRLLAVPCGPAAPEAVNSFSFV